MSALKIPKEISAGIVTILAIGLLVTGVNFLKGNSFFGGDRVFYAYFPNTGGVTPATSVYVNGVVVGKVLSVDLTGKPDSLRKVVMKFNITDDNLKIPKGSKIEAGSVDMFTKGIILTLNPDISSGFYAQNAKIQGVVSVDITSQVKAYADPISQKVQAMMTSIDKMVNDVSAFWDTSATSEIESSIREVKTAIKKFGNAAHEIEGLVAEERIKISRIMSNVEQITINLKKSNDTVKAIIGNVKRITDDLVTADFKNVIENAKNTLKSVNETLEKANKGEGTLGKLLSDESLYNELVKTNKELQNLVNDLQVHPERYIHFSVFGAKTKGVPLTNQEEQKLKQLLDSIP
jgi:phospholipid/cholesterol/gamma-HCH transport system substrate-binding protein